MYSIKPGRGPSLMGALGGIVVAIFSIAISVIAASEGGPSIFIFFPATFAIFAIIGVIYNFYNATQKDRMSTLDITTDGEESDPVAQAMGHAPTARHAEGNGRQLAGNFCPFCGSSVSAQFKFCPQCGKGI